MNFLAHVYLSGEDHNIILGNLIADAVKGRKIEKYKGGVLLGIQLHRKIDAFTDAHFCFHRSRDLLAPKYRRYSGVLVDMFYDHFLAKNWSQYSSQPLRNKAKQTYEILLDNFKILPSQTKRMLPYLIGNDWLTNYSYIGHMEKHLKGLSRRASFNSHMDEAILDLKINYNSFENDFNEFFPEIIKYSEAQILKLKLELFN